jgi:hypothetical protein
MYSSLRHDPEKCEAVFREDHAKKAPRVPSGTRRAAAGWIIEGDARMTRISAVVLIVAVAMTSAPAVSVAQTGASSRGTNSSGAAQSSGAKRGQTGALGTGNAKAPDTPSGDAVINQENAILERKLKSICRGC